MKIYIIHIHFKASCALVGFVLALGIIFTPTSRADQTGFSKRQEIYKIGVLAYKGKDAAIKRWGAHGPYLSKQLAPLKFEIVPLSYKNKELSQAVLNRQVDFVITNPGQYIELKFDDHLSRLATRYMARGKDVVNQFGGTAICKPNRNDLNSYADLAGKKILIPSRSSLGGWLVHLRKALAQGVDLRFEAEIVELKNHKKVVMAILAGEGDVGFVRSDLIEELVAEGEIQFDQLQVIEKQDNTNYPFLLSTRLYPEWPFAVVSGTSHDLSVKVLKALLEIKPTDAVAIAAGLEGWTVPGRYSQVKTLFKEIGIGPYAPEPPTLGATVKQYLYEIIMAFFVIIVLLITTIRTRVNNHNLQREITSRKRAEHTLKRYEHIISSTSEHMSFLDNDYVYQAVNKAYLQGHQKKHHEIVGHSVSDILGDLFEKYVKERLDRCLAGEEIRYQDWFDFPGLGRRYMDVAYYPYFESNGDVSGVVVSSHDITKIEQSQQDLIKSERQYRQLFNSNRDGFVVVMGAGTIVDSNPCYLKMIGYSLAELKKISFWDLTPERWHKHEYNEQGALLMERGYTDLYEKESICKDGTIIPVEVHAYTIKKGRDRESTLIGAFVRDITKRKKRQKELQNSHDTLEQKVEERTQDLKKTHEQLLHAGKLSAIGGLSASIAHEFNNPLQGIMTVLKGVNRRATLEEDDAKLMSMALSECNRMKDLIKNLQDFNRPSSGRMAMVDIHATIDSLLLLSKKEFQLKGIAVETRYLPNLPQVKAVADQIKQVILNLLNNAAHACESGGTIAIATNMSGDENITIQIKDSGTGILPGDLDKIFDPFFTTKPSLKGTGLGLSVSYGIIKKHGGRIEVVSQPGKGATFTVILPIKGVSNDTEKSTTC